MIIISVLLSYLLGAIPTAYIFGKLYKGIDIRKHGSGNVGATNVFRVLGKVPGVLVLVLDILKGVIPVALFADILGTNSLWERAIIGLCAVGGHNWTVFLNFKGGKGIATSLGVLIGLTLKVAAIRPVLLGTVFVWIISFLFTCYVSLSSILAAFALPILALITNQSFEMICLTTFFCGFVILRHKPNIKRLLSGQEPKVPLFKRVK